MSEWPFLVLFMALLKQFKTTGERHFCFLTEKRPTWGSLRGSSPGLSFYLPSKIQNQSYSDASLAKSCLPTYLPTHCGNLHSRKEPSSQCTTCNSWAHFKCSYSSPYAAKKVQGKRKKKTNKTQKTNPFAGPANHSLLKSCEARYAESVSTHQLPLFQVGLVWHSQLLRASISCRCLNGSSALH